MAVALTLGLASCQKGFNPKSYAPSKPLPTFDGYSSSKEIAPNNLVAHWAFNGNLLDSVANTSGTATGTSFGQGVSGQALQGAANAYVLATPSAAVKALNTFTISEWLNTAPPGPGIIGIFSLAKTSTFWGNIEAFFENGSNNTNGKFRLHIAQGVNDNTYSVDNIPNLFNSWVNITYIYDSTVTTGGSCSIYVNGSLVNTGDATSSGVALKGNLNFTDVGKIVFGTVQFMTTPSQTTATGSQPWAYFNVGLTDEVRIYNTALTSAQVDALYNLEKLGR